MNVSAVKITDIPDEILIEIILNLNARERIRLGNSCKRFYNLVFAEKPLLRDLNFAEEGHLTSASDIFRYINDENTNKHILKLNLRNVDSIRHYRMFFCHMSQVTNVVDLNLHGITFPNLYMFMDILKPLPHVKRLSIDFPRREDHHLCIKLQEEFSKLTYLSVILPFVYQSKGLYRAIQLSHDLKELHITVMSQKTAPAHDIDFEIELKSLEIVEYYGPSPSMVAEYFVSILSRPQEWTHFQHSNPSTEMDGFYLEKNVEVCEELLECKLLKRLSYNYPQFASRLGGFVVPLCLLKEVMIISQGNLPEKLCCFPSAENEDEGQLHLPSALQSSKLWMLKVEETKRLLRNPQYKISFLHISHNIAQECDAHIVTSTFPSLTELVLSNITKKNRKTLDKTTASNRRPERSAAPHKPYNVPNIDSSFSKLIESTPHLRSLTIIASRSQLAGDESWDLTALDLIRRWQNLTTLRLWDIPITDGKFLIEIGKQCRNLENLALRNLGPKNSCCYRNTLLQMLLHCTNLRKFTLRQNNIGHLSDFFHSLTNNQELRRVCIQSSCKTKQNSKTETATDFTPSIKYLIHRCSKLNSFVCATGMSQAEYTSLRSTLRRLASELNRTIFLDIS